MKANSPEIETHFRNNLIANTQKFMTNYLSVASIILVGFSLSDIFFRHSYSAFFTRLLPLITCLSLFLFNLITKTNYQKIKFRWYNLLLVSVLLMMYAKYWVYLPNEGEAYSITGIVVAIFILSLDLKIKIVPSLIVFFTPLTLCILAFCFLIEIPDSKMVNFSNLIPMTIIGFIANRAQYNLRKKLFTSNYLLNIEQEKTKKLYAQTLHMNQFLKDKSDKIIQQKAAIEETNKELIKTNQTKDLYVSIISHDLKTPFNAMIGFSNLLNSHYNEFPEDERRKFISIIDNSINNTYKLLTNLLEWSQAQVNGSIKTEKFNLFLLTNEILQLLNQSANNKQISIINQIEKDLELNADLNKIKTVIRNLIANAIKFSHTESNVLIKANKLEDNSTVQISVVDKGIGISEDKQKKIFDFSQKQTTKGTQNETGTGLGLLLCKEFVDKHNGEILIKSKVNEGSTFTIKIPQPTVINY